MTIQLGIKKPPTPSYGRNQAKAIEGAFWEINATVDKCLKNATGSFGDSSGKNLNFFTLFFKRFLCFCGIGSTDGPTLKKVGSAREAVLREVARYIVSKRIKNL